MKHPEEIDRVGLVFVCISIAMMPVGILISFPATQVSGSALIGALLGVGLILVPMWMFYSWCHN